MLNAVYKLRHEAMQRRRWQAAAILQGKELSQWMRDALDEVATLELDKQ